MNEISITEALFNPWVTPFWLFIFWLLIYLSFICLKVSDNTLKIIEIVYLLLGFIGIISLVDENKKERLLREQEYIKFEIGRLTKQLQFHYNYFCFEYTKGLGSPIDLDEREIDR